MIIVADLAAQMVEIEICSLIGFHWIKKFFQRQKDRNEHVEMEMPIKTPVGCIVQAGLN